MNKRKIDYLSGNAAAVGSSFSQKGLQDKSQIPFLLLKGV